MKFLIKLIKLIKGSFGYLLLFVNTLIAATLVVPIAYIKKYVDNLTVKKYCLIVIHKIGQTWVNVDYYIVKLVNNVRWQIDGLEQLEALPKDKWYLLIANHQSWNDVFILQFIFRKTLPFQKYFVKEEMRKFPLMGFIWEAIDCPFLKRRAINNQTELSSDLLEIKEKSKKFKLLPSTIVSFAEGTRFTKHKHAEQQSPYEFLLKPKTGGLACILEELNREIKGIVDVTIYYQPRNAAFWDLFTGDLNKISIKITYIPIPDWLIEKQKAKENYNDYKLQFQDWINNVWLEKDKFMHDINQLYKSDG